MDEYAEQVAARVRVARAALSAAASRADSFALQDALDELENALKLARASGVDVSADAPGRSDGGARE